MEIQLSKVSRTQKAIWGGGQQQAIASRRSASTSYGPACLAAPQALVRMQTEGLPSCRLSGSAGSPLNYIQTVKRDKCSEEAEQGGHGVLGTGREVLTRRCPSHKDEVSRKELFRQRVQHKGCKQA